MRRGTAARPVRSVRPVRSTLRLSVTQRDADCGRAGRFGRDLDRRTSFLNIQYFLPSDLSEASVSRAYCGRNQLSTIHRVRRRSGARPICTSMPIFPSTTLAARSRLLNADASRGQVFEREGAASL
jgi:hypothetical protein